ncbi:hypothetical protein ACFE04_024174 [Oxalis oulophora]
MKKNSFDESVVINPQEVFDISLRPFELADVDDFMVWSTDENVARFCSWEPHTDKEDVINYIKTAILPHPWFRAICLNKRPIGYILMTPNSSNVNRCRGEIGYVLATKYWGKGIATTAVKIACKKIFDEWSYIERLEAFVDVDNIGSQRVLEKARFTKEGVLRKHYKLKGRTRDFVLFSLLSTDPIYI